MPWRVIFGPKYTERSSRNKNVIYTSKTPGIIKPLYRDLIWNYPRTGNTVYLTFDDGPQPVTLEVMDLLAEHNAKATFFCVGSQVEKHPEIFNSLTQNGHRVANHSHTHPNGWKTKNAPYFRDVLTADRLIKSTYFRPPYGRITQSQARALKTRFSLVMWDVLSGDFDASRSAQRCAQAVIRHTEPGSIVVFHDSQKAATRMMPALRESLNALNDRGMQFSVLP